MRSYLTIICFILALAGHSEVYYSISDSITVPDEEITAVEVRVANSAARVGESKLAGWSVQWSGVQISLSFDFRNFVDGISRDCATLVCNNKSVQINKGLNTAGEFNTLAIEWHKDGAASVLVGEHKLREVFTCQLPKPEGVITLNGFGGDITIQDFIVETNPNAFERLQKYLPEQYENAEKWVYLDRINDPKTAIAGGNYELARIGNDLIYLDGAKTNASYWRPGMIKGSLTPTGFEGYYKLQWYDATGRKMPGENFAEQDDSLGIIKLTFPELGATIRLKAKHQ